METRYLEKTQDFSESVENICRRSKKKKNEEDLVPEPRFQITSPVFSSNVAFTGSASTKTEDDRRNRLLIF